MSASAPSPAGSSDLRGGGGGRVGRLVVGRGGGRHAGHPRSRPLRDPGGSVGGPEGADREVPAGHLDAEHLVRGDVVAVEDDLAVRVLDDRVPPVERRLRGEDPDLGVQVPDVVDSPR